MGAVIFIGVVIFLINVLRFDYAQRKIDADAQKDALIAQWNEEIDERAMHRAERRAEKFRAKGFHIENNEVRHLAEILADNMRERGCPYA